MSTPFQNDIVSVIIRACNSERIFLLREAIDSVCKNFYRPIEIVVVVQSLDKAYIQGVQELLSKYQKDDFHCTFVLNSTSQDERTKNLNLGVTNAQGQYLCFLDEDDLHYPNFIFSLLPTLQNNPAYAWVYGDVALASCVMVEDGGVQQQDIDFPFQRDQFSLEELFRGNFIPINSYLLDRNRIQPDLLIFDESFNLAEDYVFLLKLAIHHEPLYVKETVSVYQVFNDLSNSTFIMNEKKRIPDREKIRAWSYALWRIEVLKEALLVTYRPGLFSMKTRKYIYYRFPQLKVLIQHLIFYFRKNSHNG